MKINKKEFSFHVFKKRSHPKKDKVLSLSAFFLVVITYCVFSLVSSFHKPQRGSSLIHTVHALSKQNFKQKKVTTAATTEKPKHLFIATVDSPFDHRKASSPIGAWMKDPASSDENIFVMTNYLKNHNVQVYSDEASMTLSRDLELPYDWGGTGQVVLNDNIYYNKFNSNIIVKYNWKQRQMVLQRRLKGAGFGNQCPYQWAGSTDIDLAADNMGLWVIYGTLKNRWKIVVSKLDPDSLKVIRTWNVNFMKRSAGNAFMAYGVLYTMRRHDSFNTYLNYAFDTKTGTEYWPKIPITSKYGYISMLDYNHKEKKLYAWDKGHLVTYAINFR